MLYIGIDLGTSACKFLLTDEKGQILNIVSEEYPLEFPQPGWSQQDPADWWKAVCKGIPRLLEGFDASKVAGIGSGGQMHGLVVLNENDEVIRPAILWNDGRTQPQTEYLNSEIGKEVLSERTANIAFAGFTAPKLLWMRENEPHLFKKIRKIMLPKDYINYKLTGVHCTDCSDAGGMLLLDVKNRAWSDEMLEIAGITKEQMPALFESWETVGTLTKEAAEELGIPQSVKVAAGAGDNAAAAVGCGVVGEGRCNLSLGTSGTIFITSDNFSVDPHNALHSFPHADARQHILAPGEIILLEPRLLHEYRCIDDSCTFLCMQVSESLLPSLRGTCTEDLFPKQALSEDEYLRAMRLFLSAARAYILQEPQYELYCIGQAALLFHMFLTRMPCHRMSAEEIATRNQKNARLHRLLQYVDDNFTGKILLRDFAREEGVSINYLSGFIRRTMNQSFQEYLATVRFNYACERMISTDDKLITISLDSGFSDYRYFSAAVKSRTGHTPEKYRELLRMGGHTDRLERHSKHSREQFLSRRESLLLCDHYLEVCK